MPPKVDKEAILFLVNGGRQPKSGPDDYFEKAKEAMAQVITKKIFLRPKDGVGIMVGAARRDNDDEFGRCKLLQEVQVPSWEMVRKVNSLNHTDTRFDDWHVALSKTIDHISEIEKCRLLLILMFDCDKDCPVPTSVNVQEMANRLTERQIQLMWIGSKPLKGVPFERLNGSERILMEILEVAVGEYRQIDTALPQLRLYKKPKATFRAWNCPLELGNIVIPTSSFVQATDVMVKPTFKNLTVKEKDPKDSQATGSENSTSTSTDKNTPVVSEILSTAKNDVTTGGPSVNPDDLEYVTREREFIDRHKEAHSVEDTIPGYMYGRHFVPVPEADAKGMKYDGGPKSFKIFGFVRRESIQLEDLGGETSRIVLPAGPNSAKPFYCLAQAMADANRLAIVRRVYASTNAPKMGVLVPYLDVSGEPSCLVHVELLYAEERRVTHLQPLNTIITSLSEEKKSAVEDMIDAMMLTDCEDAEGWEVFSSGVVPSPGVQHLWNSLSHRALNPTDPLPPVSENLKKLIKPPESVILKQEPMLKRLQELFPIEDELALIKIESEKSEKLSVPVVSEIAKMECELSKLQGDSKMDVDSEDNGLKRKHSTDETIPHEELILEPDLDDLFDGDM